MNILDFVEAWWFSVRSILESAGVVVRFERSRDGQLNSSCNLNLRRNKFEADLSIWDSGEAELVVGEIDASVSQKHFDDIRNQQDLGAVLSQLVAIALPAQTK